MANFNTTILISLSQPLLTKNINFPVKSVMQPNSSKYIRVAMRSYLYINSAVHWCPPYIYYSISCDVEQHIYVPASNVIKFEFINNRFTGKMILINVTFCSYKSTFLGNLAFKTINESHTVSVDFSRFCFHSIKYTY